MVIVLAAEVVQDRLLIALWSSGIEGNTELSRASRTLTPLEQDLTVIHKEFLSLEFAFGTYASYLANQEFELAIQPVLRSYLRTIFGELLVNYFERLLV